MQERTSVMQCVTIRAMRSISDSDERLRLARSWLEAAGFGGELEVASADASFRRYFRLRVDRAPAHAQVDTGASLILMDAPPANESVEQFTAVARRLLNWGLPVPEAHASDSEQGFLLLTDFGSTDLLQSLSASPADASYWYPTAASLLHVLQGAPAAEAETLPPYDTARLEFELSLFPDWLLRQHLSLTLDSQDERAWRRLCELLVANARQQPRVAVHRDFHSRNLMVRPDGSLGVIDFQDAMYGPLTYDLVSLLRDCYIAWPLERVLGWATDWFSDHPNCPPVSEAQLLRWFFLTGVQRQLKAAGIFARLAHRDGKWGYLPDVPRTLGYITAIADQFPELRWLGTLIDERVLPQLGNA